MKAQNSKFTAAALIAMMMYVISSLLRYFLFSPLIDFLGMEMGISYAQISLVMSLLSSFSYTALTVVLYAKWLGNGKIHVGGMLTAGAACFVGFYIVGYLSPALFEAFYAENWAMRTFYDGIMNLLDLGVYFGAGMIYAAMAKIGASAPNPGNNPQPYGNPGYAYGQTAIPGDVSLFMGTLLSAVRPYLEMPMTAQLCTLSEMTITNMGTYFDVRGVVRSQSSYGAMITTDFYARAQYNGGYWSILSVSMGVAR